MEMKLMGILIQTDVCNRFDDPPELQDYEYQARYGEKIYAVVPLYAKQEDVDCMK